MEYNSTYLMDLNPGCDTNMPSNGIYRNVEYRFQAEKLEIDFLKIAGNIPEIMPDFRDTIALNMYNELRIGTDHDGSRDL
ncbi:hypothetical protein BG011_006977 [Mortierella polycephala]|uniref:Uncharacterized protein n=1 Tax=Mortierella polycephala TaxID=41804 RepID=A0A9P6QAN1_9FUNG|nr:hypothetical protein BG011_006977 [Mortierella polycephala]